MTSLDSVFSYIEGHREESLVRLFDYLARPSLSAHGKGIEEVASYIAGIVEDLGLTVEILPTDGWPMVFARSEERQARPTVLLYGHYDVQPPDPLEAWMSPPFEPTIRDGRIYARGVGDNKGQHFAQILAVEALLACHGDLPCNVKLLLEGEEEIGSPHLAPFVRQNGERLASDLVITADGPVHESGRSCILFGVRGIATFELQARGARSDLHSGNWGGVAPQPVWSLIHALSTMRDSSGRITIDGFYDDIVPFSGAERRALDALDTDRSTLMERLGTSRLDVPDDRPVAERLSLWPTLSINGFHAGYDGEGIKTIIPHAASVKCDMRLVEAQSYERVLDLVERHVARFAPEVEMVRLGGMDPSRTPFDSPFAVPLREAIIAAQGEPPLLIPALGGSLPEYVFTKILGIPAFCVPYANADEANHAPNENLEVERFFAGIRTGAAMLSYIARMSDGTASKGGRS